MITPASTYTITGVNGALADSLVQDFGRAAMVLDARLIPPTDWRLCLETVNFSGAASVAVRIFFAEQAGVAAELQVELFSTTSQYIEWTPFIVPRASATGLPYTMRITKAATNANMTYAWKWVPATGGC